MLSTRAFRRTTARHAHAASAPTGKSLIQPSDFTWDGVILGCSALGADQSCLAYRPDTDTWFMIGAQPGGTTWPLFEMNFPAPASSIGTASPMTIARYWGDINYSGLVPAWAGESLDWFSALYWDSVALRLYFSWGTFFNIDNHNYPVYGYCTIDTTNLTNANSSSIPTKVATEGTPGGLNTVVTYGVPTSAFYDNVKGNLQPTPASLAPYVNGAQWIMFGFMQSIKTTQSWGPGMVAVTQPHF